MEVKYARITSLALKPSAAVFRLRRNNRNLCTGEYADNLTTHLSSARSFKNITLSELSYALHGISAKSGVQNAVAIQDDSREFRPGEHVVAFWFESKFQWYLGVVDDVDQEEVPIISYMIRAGGKQF